MLKSRIIKTNFSLALAAMIIVASSFGRNSFANTATCADINIIFARGSGESLNDENYRNFKSELEPLLAGLKTNFYELGSSAQDGYQYPAVSIGVNNLSNISTALGAKISGGESFTFGASVNQGVNELKTYITRQISSCPNTKFVLAGYSQGAMVMSKAMRSVDSGFIAYVATFGDPKLYLPEGYGSTPKACTDSSSLSSYRSYVPDCKAYQGILDGYRPYQPNDSYEGKIGVWCNYHDLMCSSKIDWDNLMGAHTAYVSDHRYADAATIIAAKIYAALGQNKEISSPSSTHDLALLIDTTGSMTGLIDSYKTQAIKLATNVLASGGRVALYEYRDLDDPFEPRLLCDFDSCTIDNFKQFLNSLVTDGGGDAPESLLSASLTAMNTLRWRVGATKTIIALTDAGLIAPDRDGVTLSQVISRSLEIDPVHIYAMTSGKDDPLLQQLVSATGGRIFNINEELELSTEYISNLPAEGSVFYDGQPVENSEISDLTYQISDDTLQISFNTNAYRVLVILNDNILGFTDQQQLEITDIDLSENNELTLVPFSFSGDRGDSNSLNIPSHKINIGVPNTGFYKKS